MTDFSIRPLTVEERKYAYMQSQQLCSKTGCIGYLRGDFGQSGRMFYSSWEDIRPDLKTPEFKAAFDDVINLLRNEDGLLHSREDMVWYGRNHAESGFQGNFSKEYGFRVDTQDYAFLIRCIPQVGDNNFYFFCYRRDWLDKHIEKAKQDIRFVTPDYKELFHLPDGEVITITLDTGEKLDRVCRFIDETHVEVGEKIYHICEFAERMAYNGNTYSPKEPPLPPECFSTLPSSGELIKIERYQNRYTLLGVQKTPEENRERADVLNKGRGVSKAQEAAMLAGSIFGWDTPAAKPKNYNENGEPIKPKDRER